MAYVDGDDLHPQSNIDKMAAGQPLTDADREPWLQLIRTTAEHMAAEKQADAASGRRPGVVIACSALKRSYRDVLRGKSEEKVLPGHLEPPHPDALPTYFVFIDGSRDVLMDRMSKRTGHFMKAEMLDSQLATLESPAGEEGVVVVPVDASTEEQVDKARKGLSELLGTV